MQHYAAFIWVFTVCQSTRLGVSSIQRVKNGQLMQPLNFVLDSYFVKARKLFNLHRGLNFLTYLMYHHRANGGFLTYLMYHHRAKVGFLTYLMYHHRANGGFLTYLMYHHRANGGFLTYLMYHHRANGGFLTYLMYHHRE